MLAGEARGGRCRGPSSDRARHRLPGARMPRGWPSWASMCSAWTPIRARSPRSAAGELPFYEPGLEPLLRAGLKSGRLSFTTPTPRPRLRRRALRLRGHAAAGRSAAPTCPSCSSCLETLAPLLDPPRLIIGKSTVPAGTAARLTSGWRPRARRRGSSWPGTPSSCARATPSRTRCARTASWSAWRTRRPRRICARSTRRRPRRDSATGDRPGDVGAGQVRRQRVPVHEDLLHQRHGRGLRSRRRRRHAARRGAVLRSADRRTLPGARAGVRRRLPAQGHPRLHGPGRGTRVARRCRSSEVDAINMRRRARTIDLAASSAAASWQAHRRMEPPSSPTPTTCATRRRWTWRRNPRPGRPRHRLRPGG